ncbi:MAG: hypothetical protein AAFY69_03280 [Pseudomonadota bacterium]
MADPHLQLDQLRRISVSLAVRVMCDLGELWPMAAVLRENGDIVAIGGETGDAALERSHRIERLRFRLRRDIDKRGYVATAVIYDALVENPTPGTVDVDDAIAIELDHRDGVSLFAHVPYEVAQDGPIVGDAETQPGGDYIFRHASA